MTFSLVYFPSHVVGQNRHNSQQLVPRCYYYYYYYVQYFVLYLPCFSAFCNVCMRLFSVFRIRCLYFTRFVNGTIQTLRKTFHFTNFSLTGSTLVMLLFLDVMFIISFIRDVGW
jgi:hypothetical protein